MNNICVSIIMPSLNVVNYIEKAVRSVMNQTLDDIEIICVDAESQDGTLEILNRLANEDSRIKLAISTVRSYGYQVNLGISHAKGRYIAIVETDDFVSPDYCRKLYQRAKQYDADIVKCNYYAFYTRNNQEEVLLPRESVLNRELYDRVIVPKEEITIATSDWYLWTGLYKKQMIEDNSIRFNESPGAAFQDIGFLHKTNSVSGGSIYIDEYLYYYCIDRADSSSNIGKGIAYSYYEYTHLFEYEWDKKQEAILYARMAGFFAGCVNGIEQKDVNDTKTREMFDWFLNKLEYAIDNDIINSESVSSVVWSQIYPLVKSIDEAYSHLAQRDERIMRSLGKPDEVKIIIFGCGRFGALANEWINKKGYKLVGYSDNNNNLWGEKINGVSVISPNELDTVDSTLRFLIANELHYQQITKQLIDIGIREEQLCVFRELSIV